MSTPRTFGKIHAADLRKSARLQRAYRFLEDGRWHTTREIQIGADCCNPNTAKAELIANGCQVECEQRGKLFFYRMTAGVKHMGPVEWRAA